MNYRSFYNLFKTLYRKFLLRFSKNVVIQTATTAAAKVTCFIKNNHLTVVHLKFKIIKNKNMPSCSLETDDKVTALAPLARPEKHIQLLRAPFYL